jgi:hypothetical protein
MRSPLTIMTVYSVASRLPSLRSALRGLDTTSVHGQLKSWATAMKPPAGALTKKTFRTQTRYSWCPRNRGNSASPGSSRESFCGQGKLLPCRSGNVFHCLQGPRDYRYELYDS